MPEPARREHEPPTGTASRVADVVDVVVGAEPVDAERARTLAAGPSTAVLATIARDPAGTPFASLTPHGLDERGRPILCISELAEHTRNLHLDARCSLLIAATVAPGEDPLAAGRVTLLGEAEPVEESELDEARAVHLAGNPHAAAYLDYGDFALWRLQPTSIRYVGGYGRMSWIDVESWSNARPDPVAAFADSVIEHLNTDHAAACLLIAQVLGARPDATDATAVHVDRYGLDFAVSGADGTGRVRLPFSTEATTPTAVREATVELVHTARSR